MEILNSEWYLPILGGFGLGLAAMVLHEAAHILLALAAGIKVKRIGLEWKGLYTLRDPGPPLKNFVVTLAGPLMNVVLIASWHWSPTFGLANLTFAAVNLLPISGSDGVRAAHCWHEIRKNHQLARSAWSAFSGNSGFIQLQRPNDGWNAAQSQTEIPGGRREDRTVATR